MLNSSHCLSPSIGWFKEKKWIAFNLHLNLQCQSIAFEDELWRFGEQCNWKKNHISFPFRWSGSYWIWLKWKLSIDSIYFLMNQDHIKPRKQTIIITRTIFTDYLDSFYDENRSIMDYLNNWKISYVIIYFIFFLKKRTKSQRGT